MRHGLKDLVGLLNDREAEGDRLYVAIVGRFEVMSFSHDNWRLLANGSDKMLKDLRNHLKEPVVVMVRRFDERHQKGRIPRKSVAGYRTYPDRIECLDAAELQECCSYDAETGAPLPPEPQVTYISGQEMIPALRDVNEAVIIPFGRNNNI